MLFRLVRYDFCREVYSICRIFFILHLGKFMFFSGCVILAAVTSFPRWPVSVRAIFIFLFVACFVLLSPEEVSVRLVVSFSPSSILFRIGHCIFFTGICRLVACFQCLPPLKSMLVILCLFLFRNGFYELVYLSLVYGSM